MTVEVAGEQQVTGSRIQGGPQVPPTFVQNQGPDLQNILRQSYDNAKVTINLRRTSDLQNSLQ